jgi:succinate dehydrogenase / fumarate reductase cytochrome b subunit
MEIEKAPAGTGVWAWLLQRITAVLIGVFIIAHIWALHFASRGPDPITFESVRLRLSNPWFQALDILLLATAIYHSLNGARAVLLDLGVGIKSRRRMDSILVALGMIAFAYGVVALISFMTGQPLLR